MRSGFKANISAEHGETFRLQGEKIGPEHGETFRLHGEKIGPEYFDIYREKLIKFPLERLLESEGGSYDFVKSLLPKETSQPLLKQSVALNCLSCATPKQIEGGAGKLGLRFHTRFIYM